LQVGVVNRFLSIDEGFRERLVVVPGQFRVAPGTTTTGTQRLYSDLQYQVYHAPYTVTDFVAPSIWQVEAISTSLFLRLRVRVEDDAGDVARVVVLYREEGDMSWTKAELPYDAVSRLAEAFLTPVAGPIYYFAQAVDSAGNVALALDHGNPFTGPEDGDLWDASLPRSLTVEQAVSRDTLAEGEVTAYTIVVNSTGWGMISSGLVSTTLPEGLALAGPVTIEPADAGTTGTLPALARGLIITPLQAVTITFPVRALDGPARITSTVAVTSAQVCTPETGRVVVTVTNVEPVAVSDEPTVDEDSGANAIDVLINDHDVPGDPLSIVALESASHGTVTWSNSVITFTPDADFAGGDVFTYTISDDDGGRGTAIVIVTVNAVNDAPVAVNDSVTTSEERPVAIDVLENDNDIDGKLAPNSLAVSSGPSNGSTSVNTSTGVIVYTPNENWSGEDGFNYQICDDGTPLPALCSTARVTVTVIPDGDNLIYLPLVVRNTASVGQAVLPPER
jgi:hypothetical protein